MSYIITGANNGHAMRQEYACDVSNVYYIYVCACAQSLLGYIPSDRLKASENVTPSFSLRAHGRKLNNTCSFARNCKQEKLGPSGSPNYYRVPGCESPELKPSKHRNASNWCHAAMRPPPAVLTRLLSLGRHKHTWTGTRVTRQQKGKDWCSLIIRPAQIPEPHVLVTRRRFVAGLSWLAYLHANS